MRRVIPLHLVLLLLVTGSTYADAAPQFVTMWGSQGNGLGQFSLPPLYAGLGPLGEVWVSDPGGNRIHKFTDAGGFLFRLDTRGQGPGEFDSPRGIAIADDGIVYVVDAAGSFGGTRIQRFTSSGDFIDLWGSPGNGPGQFIQPRGIAVSEDIVYIADSGNHRIQKLTAAGVFLDSWGGLGSGAGEFQQPADVALDESGNVYVSDFGNQRIQKFTPEGAFLLAWTLPDHPDGIAVRSDGRVYVPSSNNHVVRVFSLQGGFLEEWGGEGTGPGQLRNPSKVAVNDAGDVFVVDRGNSRIQKFRDEMRPVVGSVAGRVVADCPALDTSLLGVHVDAFEVGSGDLVGAATTDASGVYLIEELPAGPYIVTVVTPLGYTASSTEVSVTVVGGETTAADFSLHCVSITANPRTIGFWKHQVGVATGGRGQAQVDGSTLCSYLDLIAAHFNSNAINHVVVYEPPASGACSDKLQVAKQLLNLPGSVAMIARAGQQLMALLFNVAAGYISLTEVISADGATLSQAITYCDNLIDDPSGNHELAKTIADQINNGLTVAAEVIPLTTQNIAYARGARVLEFGSSPNPAGGRRSFAFVLAGSGPVGIEIFDISGRLVANPYRGALGPGRHVIQWDGKREGGAALGHGLYFARLSTQDEARVVKLVQGAP